MATSTRALMSNILKRVYPTNKMYKTFNQKNVLMNLIGRSPQEVTEGEQFRYNVHKGGSSAGAHIAEGGTIPATDQQRNDWMVFNMTTYLHGVDYTGQLKHTTKNKEAAVAKAVDFIVRGAMKDARDDFNVAMYAQSNGLLTKCRSGTSTTVFTVANPRRLRVGMDVAIALLTDNDDYTIGVSSTVITDISGRTVTVATVLAASSATWTLDAYGNANYGVFLNSENGGSAIVRPYGLEDIIKATVPDGMQGATTNHYGTVDRSTAGNDWAKGRILPLAGGSIDHDVADEAADLVEVAGNGEIEFWLTSPEIFREIIKLHVGTKRATMREKVGDGWFTTAELAGRKVYKDKHCTPGVIYGIDPNNIWIAENKPLGWEDDDGDMWHRRETTWSYQALLTRMYQLCAIPNCHVAITDVNYTSYSGTS